MGRNWARIFGMKGERWGVFAIETTTVDIYLGFEMEKRGNATGAGIENYLCKNQCFGGEI
jgi:hypothetical protein